jgi:predicted phage terminase large subunit-like protein
MPRAGAIDPKTGKRYNFVDPDTARKAEAKLQMAATVYRTQERALIAKDDLLAFTQFTMPDPEAQNDLDRSTYEAKSFHKAVAKHLEEVERGGITQLIFCMPPRHGKTEMATKRLAAWYSGRHPEQDIAVASYSDTMAEDMGADTRAIMAHDRFKLVFPQHSLRRGGTAKTNIQTVRGGRIVFVGRGGALTGRGANLLLIDDLFKDHEEARSQAIRDQAWNWFTKVAMTRRMGKKLVVITMTRWHSDDIIGRLTDPENPNYSREEAENWKIIRLPAVAEEDDVLGRQAGEALWPERYDLRYLQQQQRLDPLGFAALFQQRPTVADGTLFRANTIQRYSPDELPSDLRIYCASDHAVGTNQRNDPSCFIKVGVDSRDDIYVLECIWKRMPTDEAVEAMLALAGGKQKPLLWWAERGHISKSIGPFLHKRMLETGTYINLVEVTPANDKQQRAQSIAARVSMGKVKFPKLSAWTERAINELLAFPNGNHDDFVDALAYIGLGLQSQFGPSTSQATKPAPLTGTFSWLKRNDKYLEDKRRAAQGGF